MLIPVVLALVLYGPLYLILVVVMALTLISLLEFNRLTAQSYRSGGGGVLAPLIGLIVPIYAYAFGQVFSPLYLVLALLVILSFAAIGAPNLRHVLTEAALKTTGLLYIALPLSIFVLLAAAPQGRPWILFFLTVIWCNDSFAFATGKAMGRHKLCPSISPGKTIEGALGGIASGVVAALVFNAIARTGVPGFSVLAALVIGVLGLAGDLFESVIKRGAGVKDSGTIVPGHGGLLDRLDSMFFSLPVLYLLVIHLQM